MKFLLKSLFITFLFVNALSALAEVKINNAWLRLLPPTMTTTAAYMDISSDREDTLIDVSSSMATRVEIHQSSMKEGVMYMSHVKQIKVSKGGQISLSPQSYHLMVIGIKQPLERGKTYPMTFHFQQAGEVEIQVPVVAR